VKDFSLVVRTGNSLRIFLHDTEKAAVRIKSLMTKKGIEIAGLRKRTPNLEDCFMDIVSREEAR